MPTFNMKKLATPPSSIKSVPVPSTSQISTAAPKTVKIPAPQVVERPAAPPVNKVTPAPVAHPKAPEPVIEKKPEVVEEKSDSKVFKPIKRTGSTTSKEVQELPVINGPEEKPILPTDKSLVTLDQEGMNTLVNTIVGALSEQFVSKTEVEGVVQKTLQHMVLEQQKATKKK